MLIGIGGLVGAALGFFATRSLFGAFLGYFIGSSFDKFNSNSSRSFGSNNYRGSSFSNDASYYSSRITQNDFATARLVLSGAVMKADGKILKSELDYVKDFFRQQFSPQLSAKYISDFKDILKKNFVLIEICNTINNSMPLRQRSLLIQYLFGIAQVTWAIIEKNSNEIVKYLISKEGNGVNKLTHDGRTYIFWAMYRLSLIHI